MKTYLGTANPGFSPYAMDELRRRIQGTKLSGLAPGETFSFTSGDVDADQLIIDLRRKEPIFLRHLFPIDAEVDVSGNAEDTAVALKAYAMTLGERVKGKKVAIQVRKEQNSPFPYTRVRRRSRSP
jgi:23S rRNA (cytidine2498-2'-O)-methyltransferase